VGKEERGGLMVVAVDVLEDCRCEHQMWGGNKENRDGWMRISKKFGEPVGVWEGE